MPRILMEHSLAANRLTSNALRSLEPALMSGYDLLKSAMWLSLLLSAKMPCLGHRCQKTPQELNVRWTKRHPESPRRGTVRTPMAETPAEQILAWHSTRSLEVASTPHRALQQKAVMLLILLSAKPLHL
mmetsp:Transcript_16722/g.46331  ORF Transcript_16722/g.46331 Transcript_16722/m.46331 type:complete len:129 (+) Transcript_16722:300-686(+)